MTARILSGKEASAALLESLRSDVAALDPKLVVVQVGEDPASSSYVKQKMKSCTAIGMRHEHMHLPETTTREELLSLVRALNDDDDVTGFIVQLPLPKHLHKDVEDVIDAIDPRKDIDGFTPGNLGHMFLGHALQAMAPATPAGIMAMIDHYHIDVAGKHCVVIGRSNTVGKPVAVLLLNRAATVTVCHSKTADLAALTRQADVLVVAVGKVNLVTADMVKPGAIVIDVGINRTEKGLRGDVDFDAVKEIASDITPVPGGVGLMTVAALLENCVRAAKARRQR